MVVVFPDPLTPTTRTTAGGSATTGSGFSVAFSTSSRCSRMSCFNSPASPDQLAVHPLAGQFQNLGRGAHPQVGAQKRVFQFLEQVRIDLLLPRQDVFETGEEARARLLDALLETIEEAGLLLDGTEQGLDHGG